MIGGYLLRVDNRRRRLKLLLQQSLSFREIVVQTGPLLSISIPTYNRAKFLDRLLTAIYEQAANDPRLEVIVSDNASTDGTREVVDKFQAWGMKFRYVRNPENIGGNPNMLRCFEMCTGRYAWVFGDDDIIAPGALPKLLQLLEGGEYDLVFLAPYLFPGDSDRFLPQPTLWPHTVNVTSDPSRLVDLVNTYSDFDFITATILNRERARQLVEPDLGPYIADHILQMGWILPLLKNMRRGVYVQAQWLGRAEFNAHGGYDLARHFGMCFANSVNRWLDGNPALKKKTVDNHLTMGLISLALHIWEIEKWSRFHPIKVDNPHKKLVPYFGRNPRYWLCTFPMIVLPKPLSKAWALPWMVRRKLLRFWYQRITPSIKMRGTQK
jgi:glycosyltransferase involved in cell wall biosynthesis